MRGRPKAELVLTQAEHEQLTALTLRRKTAQALALRARIVLACAEGVDNKTVAARQRVTQQTVSKWRARFVEYRLDGLLDAPRPGAPRTIDDARVDAVVAKTLESVPEGATHWSTRLMAREVGMSQSAVSRIWRAFGLQPHRQETFTYLLAAVEVVATYKLHNLDRVKMENLFHRIFSNAQIDISIDDRFGSPVKPREWFLVPLQVIDEAVERIRDGSITEVRYDPQLAKLVKHT